jgi:transposase
MSVQRGDRIAMSQRERDRLKVLHGVKEGRFTQAKAAELLGLTVRQVRRLQQRWQEQGDAGLVHRLRGQPSNHRLEARLKERVLRLYRRHYPDFGPTLASEKLAEQGLQVAAGTLRRWLVDAGLWQRQRRRECHRRRRPRRSCFGELVQMDTSIHDWAEGRGEAMVLLTMIDDATSQVMARFYASDTVEAHFDLLGRWLKRSGRPVALYTDRHSIFEPQAKGRFDAEGQTQFSRALAELAQVTELAENSRDFPARSRRKSLFDNARSVKAVCSEDLPPCNEPRRFAILGVVAPTPQGCACFFAAVNVARMARSTPTGPWWSRTGPPRAPDNVS